MEEDVLRKVRAVCVLGQPDQRRPSQCAKDEAAVGCAGLLRGATCGEAKYATRACEEEVSVAQAHLIWPEPVDPDRAQHHDRLRDPRPAAPRDEPRRGLLKEPSREHAAEELGDAQRHELVHLEPALVAIRRHRQKLLEVGRHRAQYHRTSKHADRPPDRVRWQEAAQEREEGREQQDRAHEPAHQRRLEAPNVALADLQREERLDHQGLDRPRLGELQRRRRRHRAPEQHLRDSIPPDDAEVHWANPGHPARHKVRRPARPGGNLPIRLRVHRHEAAEHEEELHRPLSVVEEQREIVL
mmetsp:Transcript_11570/g.31352  ORF Transcript_11570/g.31352 Transcript_11570/m.31352 type:complete len:299 (-) Transcript_11570:644-1540(-)